MSSLASTTKPGGPYRKPRADVYTVLLVLAMIALVLGILCLYFEMQRFQFDFQKEVPAPPQPLQLTGLFGGEGAAPGDYVPHGALTRGTALPDRPVGTGLGGPSYAAG